MCPYTQEHTRNLSRFLCLQIAMSRTPQQVRLDEHVPTQTDKFGEVTMARMHNQWKTSAAYITTRDADERPSKQFLPGATASGARRVFTDEVTARYEPKQTMFWPPRLP